MTATRRPAISLNKRRVASATTRRTSRRQGYMLPVVSIVNTMSISGTDTVVGDVAVSASAGANNSSTGAGANNSSTGAGADNSSICADGVDSSIDDSSIGTDDAGASASSSDTVGIGTAAGCQATRHKGQVPADEATHMAMQSAWNLLRQPAQATCSVSPSFSKQITQV